MAHSDTPPQSNLIDSVATSFTVACAFFTDPEGRVLIVKPNYRDDWYFVGGLVDKGELPHEGCAREIKEEIGLDVPVGALLTLDWQPTVDLLPMPQTFYLFDGGVIEDPDQIRLQAEELDDFRFVPADEAVSLSAPLNRPRIPMALDARRAGTTLYQPTYRHRDA
ncbi:NUDIX hydrolase [Glycomyces sp. L485]|uniref:NUDIX domain-containing protein n=1 Tax=Glycomyces sp. L485 TaxID=2909235 RepID=UPI001F4AED68|nr:NUDIX hydrolase [Glycomyces sp. L485]MCH7229320.1 NUDIX hydrolase [Glycomyces sp. L485]